MKRLCLIAAAVLATLVVSNTSKATPAGLMNVANCAGVSMTLTLTGINFGNGCIETGGVTNVTYTGGGPLLPNDMTGLIKNLSIPSGAVTDFITFSDQPNLHFDLVSLGPGVANTTCTGLVLGQSCSPVAGSPIVLTATPTGTSISLSALLTARDTTGSIQWSGAFTTQLAGTPATIQATLLSPQGSVISTYSGSFGPNPNSTVPEPATMLLLGTGLVGIAAKLKRRKKAV